METYIYIISGVLLILIVTVIIIMVQFANVRKDLSKIRKVLTMQVLPEDYHEKEKMIFQYMMDQSKGNARALPNHLLDDGVKRFMFNNIVESIIYVHYTSHKEIAEKIINEGFLYRESFHKTAQNVINDPVQILNNHLNYKNYGHYIVVICFPEKGIHELKEIIQEKKTGQMLLENILSDYIDKDENNDNMYLLPSKYIKGYFDYTTGEIVENKNFNPLFEIQILENRIKNL